MRIINRLELAHKKLDEAVFAVYGWESDLRDEEILEKLLSLAPSALLRECCANLERAGKQK